MIKTEVEHSKKFELVKDYYESGKWNEGMVRNAVVNPKGDPWITQAECDEILGEN